MDPDKPKARELPPWWVRTIISLSVAVILAVLATLLWPTIQKTLGLGPDNLSKFWVAIVVAAIFSVTSFLVYFVAKRPLWDLLDLLIVPVALAGLGFWFTMQQEARQQAVEDQRSQDTAVQAYINQMSKSLTGQNNLLESKRGSNVRVVARARTLTVFGILNNPSSPFRKGSVLQFLYESDLIGHVVGKKPDPSGAILAGATLHGADLRGGDLSGAILNDANLQSTYLKGTNLSDASLRDANLREAYIKTNTKSNCGESARIGTSRELMTTAEVEKLGNKFTDLEGATMPNEPEHP